MKKHILSIVLSVAALGAIAAGCAVKNDEPDVYYTIRFVMPDGSLQERIVKKGGSLNSEDIPAIEIEGYEGAKWSRKQFDNVTSDLRVTVDYSESKAIGYVVKYDVNGGVPLADGSVTYDAEYTLAEPAPPAGKYFCYWYNVDDPCLKNDDPSDDYKANVSLKGTWKIAGANKTINLKAEYKDEEGVVVTFTQTGQPAQQLKIEKGQKITEEQLKTIKIVQDEGYEPYEWNFDFDTPITETTQIVLKEAVPKTFEITYGLGEITDATLYGSDGKTAAKNTQSVKYGESVQSLCYAEAPLKKHMKFIGWKVSGEGGAEFAKGQTYSYAENITLVAQWREMTKEEIEKADKTDENDESNWTGFY